MLCLGSLGDCVPYVSKPRLKLCNRSRGAGVVARDLLAARAKSFGLLLL